IAGEGGVDAARQKVSPVRKGVQALQVIQMPPDGPDIGDVHGSAPTQVPLNSKAPVVHLGWVVAVFNSHHGRRSEELRGAKQILHGRVIDNGRYRHWWPDLEVDQIVDPVQVGEHAESAADRGLSVSEDVISEAEAGHHLDRRLLVDRPVDRYHTV